MPNKRFKFWESYHSKDETLESCLAQLDSNGSDGVDDDESFAAHVVKHFGLEVEDDSIGGSLSGIDIKSMDALLLIKLSLLEYSSLQSSRGLFEPHCTSEGKIKFIEIGKDIANFDYYYQVQSGTYREDTSGVLITGRKPIPYFKDTEWRPIWGSKEDGDYSKSVFNVGALKNNCSIANFSQYATIIYDDPNLSSSYIDGIDNLYEIDSNNPYDRIIGYAYHIEIDDSLGLSNEIIDKMSITETKQPEVILAITKDGIDLTDGCTPRSESNSKDRYSAPLGTKLVKPPTMPNNSFYNQDCFLDRGSEVNFEDGLKVDIPSKLRFRSVRNIVEDKFIRISDVYLVGRSIDQLKSIPYTDSDALQESVSNAKVQILITKPTDEIFKLEVGKHYQIAYTQSSDGVIPYIIFADLSHNLDPTQYGANVNFLLHEDCPLSSDWGEEHGTGTILPTGPHCGILVSQVFVTIILNTPAIQIYHPGEITHDSSGGTACLIADNLTKWVLPLVLVDEPPPVAFNGSSIDQSQDIIDNDPTTQQNFSITELAKARAILDRGNGLELTIGFLDEDKTRYLSGNLYNYLQGGDSSTTSGLYTTYSCGPEIEPELGQITDSGSFINEINYSYTDASLYTITVVTGPYLDQSLPTIDSSVSSLFKQTESYKAEATVLKGIGDNIHFLVRVDGVGERVAINCVADIIRAGDKVSVTLTNNPVEV